MVDRFILGKDDYLDMLEMVRAYEDGTLNDTDRRYHIEKIDTLHKCYLREANVGLCPKDHMIAKIAKETGREHYIGCGKKGCNVCWETVERWYGENHCAFWKVGE
ncbi:MAG: hypothetical protein ACRCX7_11350 [Cetobacterium sp.]|uniref:hypothetical protein n=1 Tax=Cetobacterium sp. TaxID=2071632 RepID=UPI003F41B081